MEKRNEKIMIWKGVAGGALCVSFWCEVMWYEGQEKLFEICEFWTLL